MLLWKMRGLRVPLWRRSNRLDRILIGTEVINSIVDAYYLCQSTGNLFALHLGHLVIYPGP